MEIDAQAPLNARKDVIVAASPEAVWTALTGIERWPEWQSDVSSVSVTGPLALGTVFHWRAKGLAITSTIESFEPHRRVGWTGRSLGMRAIHLWTLGPKGDGTRVTTEESLSGWMARILKLLNPTFLEQSLVQSLQALKHYVEQRTG